MAIDRIPGVGPTNAEIAAAVAAPSASTIASAVAAPSAATIAAAVAAPSSATIASAVAAAVPTTAGITSIVQANAGSPFGGTYTQIANTTTNNVGSATVSGLGGYKYLKIHFYIYNNNSSAFEASIRYNGDSAANYFTVNNYTLNQQTSQRTWSSFGSGSGYIFPAPGFTSVEIGGTVEIKDNNATNHFKDTRVWAGNSSYGGATQHQLNGQIAYMSASVISSITLITSNSSSFVIRVWGAN